MGCFVSTPGSCNHTNSFALLGLANGVFKYAGLIAEKEANQAELVAYTTRILGKEQTDFDAVYELSSQLQVNPLKFSQLGLV